uniref:DNA-directed RNA polymerase subunit beta n=1 Tax=Lygus hesperus TaxID=30085 RepID=A0A0A9YIV1_LYGHE
MGEMKLNDVEEYTPGEIYQSQKPQRHIAGSCQPFQGVQWTPRSLDFYKPFDINSVPLPDNYLYNMVKKRQQLDLASTLREDSDYSLKDGFEAGRAGRPAHSEVTQLRALPPGTTLRQPERRFCTEHFFCECHQHHSLPTSNPLSKTIVCDKCGCEYNLMDPSMIDASRRIMAAANSHIAGTNPYCFRDVIGRN